MQCPRQRRVPIHSLRMEVVQLIHSRIVEAHSILARFHHHRLEIQSPILDNNIRCLRKKKKKQRVTRLHLRVDQRTHPVVLNQAPVTFPKKNLHVMLRIRIPLPVKRIPECSRLQARIVLAKERVPIQAHLPIVPQDTLTCNGNHPVQRPR